MSTRGTWHKRPRPVSDKSIKFLGHSTTPVRVMECTPVCFRNRRGSGVSRGEIKTVNGLEEATFSTSYHGVSVGRGRGPVHHDRRRWTSGRRRVRGRRARSDRGRRRASGRVEGRTRKITGPVHRGSGWGAAMHGGLWISMHGGLRVGRHGGLRASGKARRMAGR